MSQGFSSSAYKGRNSWWRYALVLSSVTFYWFVGAYFMVIGARNLLRSCALDELVCEMISGAMPFLFVSLWLVLMVEVLHRRPFRSLITAGAVINFKRIGQGFVFWLSLMALWTGLDMFLWPHHYQWSFDPRRWFLLLLLSLAVVPLKVATEELLFRGYVMQGLRLATRRSWLLMLMSGAIFALPHFNNPEMQRGAFIEGALYYFFWGVVFAAIALKDNGLELAIGVHTAHNLFSYLMVTTPDSVTATPALWVHQATVSPLLCAIGLLVNGGLFYYVFFAGAPAKKSPVYVCAHQACTPNKSNRVL